MAATQAESQQNEVNREQVQQEQPPDLSNAVLQNGTEKNGGRGIVGSDNLVNSKSKSPGQNSLSAEMSQYRQESGAGPPIHNNAGNGEQNTNSASVDNNKLNSDGKPYPQNSEQSVGNDQNYGKGSDSGRNMQGYGSPSLGFPGRGNYHPDQHSSGNPVQNSADSGNLHQNHPFSQFSSQSMRHGFPSSKPMPGTPMVPPRPPSGGPNMNAPSGGFSPHGQQQRFMSGQSISQPTGPTPTLNQLLQSSNPVHRYTNSYGEFGMQKTGPEQGSPGNMPYNQQWQPQRPLASYSPQQGVPGYRNQPPGGRGSQQPPYTPGPGAFPPQQQQQQQQPQPQPSQAAGPASQPGAASQQQQHQYPPYPQRYPTPPGPGPGPPGPGPGAPARQPFPPHQLNTPYGQPVGPSGQPPQSPQQQQQQQHGGYGEQRGGTWGPSQSPHPPTQPPAAQQQQPPPHPPQSPHPVQQPPPSPLPSPGAHQPQPSPQPQPPPPSPSQQHTQQQSQFPNRPQQPSTPNAHAPDTGDLTGANSNDSSSGLGPTGPGTPGMRPTPSPTGSTGSRSMSPAVQGQQNIPMGPHPSSGQSDGSATRMSHSPMATQGGYQQQPLAPPPHMHGGYKIGAPTPQQMSPYTPQGQQQYPQGNFNPRAQGQVGSMQYGPSQGYGPGPTSQQSPQANNMGSGQYPGRGMPNHVSHSQFGYQGGWGGPAMNQGPPAMMGGKGGPPTNPAQPPATPPGPRPHTPPHYLKQHLQHKMGFGAQGTGMPPSPGPGPPYGPGGIGNAGSPGMGPPGNMTHMGSPMGPPPAGHHHSGMAPPTSMGPPGPGSGMGPPSTVSASAPLPNSHGSHEGPMPPPPSNSHPPHGHEMPDTHDNGIPTPGPAALNSSVTSVVTTGPDGTPLDEGSQQSTLSNASAASGEEPGCPPKSRKEPGTGYPPHGHPPTPQSTAPSPGAASVNSMHEEYGEVNSPSWPRTPASPGSHPLGESKKPGKKLGKKPDSLCKLYEMDESHERRMWLDKLLQYMEERGTPISACPTISKNPLDLFRLYLFVKERGGFMEVTKNKTWKDIAGLLGIGASSSAAYTLRKHYTKNLLAFECHFDRGGIDPQPIINQVEATSKKKGAKAASVPSPGSSNSQDSFPAGSSGSMDGYGYGYQPGAAPDYNSPPMQRPASQTNAPSPHPGALGAHLGAGDNISVSNPFDDVTGASGPSYGPRGPSGMQPGYQGGQGGYSQYPDQYNRGPEFNQQYPPGPAGSYPPNRPMYPPYPEGGDRSYQQGSNPPAPGMQPAGAQDPYNRYMGAQPPGYPSRTGYSGPPQPPTAPPNAQQPGGYPPQQDYYRQDQMHSSSQLARQLVAPQSPIKSPYQGYPGQPPSAASPYPGGPSKTMPPPAPQPRRHPDFAKDQQQPPFPPYGQQRPSMYAGWNNNQYRGQGYPGQGPVGPQGPQPWNQGPPRPPGPPNSQPANNQWDQHRYPNSGQPPYPPQQSPQQWPPNMASSGPNSLRPSMGPRPPFRPEGKQFGQMPPPPGMKGNMSQPYPQQSTPKREIIFPLESVEATMPVLYKRKRMARSDVSPVEAWRLMMSLKSGLLAESCWALDVLNILLFDDTSVVYFGLGHMPGLLDVLLEHFRKALANMFDALPPTQPDCKWYDIAKPENMEVDLGSVSMPIECNDRFPLLETTTNYTLQTRKGEQIKVVTNSDIFVLDTHKAWDIEGETTELSITAEVNQDPWQLATADHVSTKYIVSCFQGEFGTVPFVRLLPDRPAGEDGAPAETPAEDIPDTSLRLSPKLEPEPEPEPAPEKTEVCSSEKANVISKGDVVVSKELVIGVERKNCEKKKRTKTLSDVLSRIKKEPVEVNDILTREIREKVEQNEIVLKKEAREEEKSVLNGKTNVCDDKAEEPKTNLPVTNEEPAKTIETGSREEPVVEVAKPVVETSPVEEVTPVEESDSSKAPEVKEEIKEEIEEELNKLQIRDPAGTLKRRRVSDYEDECYARDEASLYLVTETQDSVARRCLCLSNILRNLTFVPGNELEFAKSGMFLGLLGKLLLLHHEHPARTQKQRNYDREEDADFADSCSSLQGEGEWWWEFLHHIRENVLVTAANIAGHMDLSQHPEEVSRPVLDGLLHWAVCPAAHGQDPFPSATSTSPLSPQRLALEALCKLCVTDANVDLVLATPPYSRLERLCAVLTKFLSRSEEQVLREFAVNLLHYLAAADSGMARTVALQSPCVSLLVAFVEQAEASALGVANQHGIGALRDNPDSMGTSLDMLRRAAGTLLHLARHPDNRPLFLQQEQRLLALVMSQILDQQVASVISRVLFQCSRPVPETQHRPPS